MKRNAQITLQFNWIFTLIAGVIILTFFVMVVMRATHVAELKRDAKLADDLEATIEGSSVAANTATLLQIPEQDLLLSCDIETCDPSSGCGEASLTLPTTKISFPIEPLFSPSKIRSADLVTFTYPWEVPYRATNFLMLSSPQYTIEIDTIPAVAEKMKKDLPPQQIKIGLQQRKGLQWNINGDRENRILKVKRTFGQEYDLTVDLGQGDIDGSGTIKFPDGQSYFLGRASVYAALFAENKDAYECNMLKAVFRLQKSSQILKARAEEIQKGYAGSNTACAEVFTSAGTAYALIIDNTQKIAASTDPTTRFQPLIDIGSSVEKLKQLNHNAQIYSCASVY
ncbi:hypothetical protein HZB02_01025 [Candidatus Woesearchaeota archaeon]|nr:hypothetical protein [Candidatus Woesearchaeota archaeon]